LKPTSTPISHILLNTKEESHYIDALSDWAELIQKIIKIPNEIKSVRAITTDFEIGLMKATSDIFKKENKGCFFHYSQAIWRKIKELGLFQGENKETCYSLILKLSLLVFRAPD
jgi:hypothetical protein